MALYITALAEKGRKVATIRRRLVAISSIHKAKSLQSPCDRSQRVLHEVMQGICRALGTHQQGKRPILLGMLRKVLGNLDASLSGVRDRALLLCGFAGGLRRSELSSMRAENLWRHSRGITVFLPSSKTDQEGKGREVEIVRGTQTRGTPAAKLTCPVRSLEIWLKAGQITAGPVFRHITAAQTIREGLSGHSIGWIIKRAFRRAGFTTAELQHYSAHSLASGFCIRCVQERGQGVGHRSPDRSYHARNGPQVYPGRTEAAARSRSKVRSLNSAPTHWKYRCMPGYVCFY